MFNTNYFYYSIINKITANFGSLFDKVIFVKDSSSSPPDSFYVPLSFAPRNYFIAKCNENTITTNNGKADTSYSLPSMSFEITGFEYDSNRQTNLSVSIPESLIHKNNSTRKRTLFNLVPYNIQYRLNIFTRKYEDLLPIIEQILPYFAPNYPLNVILSEELNIRKTMNVSLTGNSFEDEWENTKTEYRLLTHMIDFNVEAYLIPSYIDSNIIKQVDLRYYFINSNNLLAHYQFHEKD
jgi:hypothetical protein